MNSAKITTAAVAALLLAAGGAYYGAQSERALSSALTQARQKNAKLEAQLREAEKQSAAASADAAKADRKVKAAEAEAAGLAFLADHPEVKEKIAALVKASGMGASFRISRELNLSPEQSARVAEIMNPFLVSLGNYVSGYGDMTIRIGSLISGTREQAIRDLLGAEGFEKFSELDALNDAGETFNIRGLSNALYFTDAPLTSQQARSLEKIASDLTKNHADITDPRARWGALMEQARSVLSPEQMNALVTAGDRYIWLQTMEKWRNDYDEARVVTTPTNPNQ